MFEMANKFIELLSKIPLGLLLSLSFVLVALLFLSDGFASTLSVKEFREEYRKYLGPSLLLALALTINNITAAIRKYLSGKRYVRNLKQQLHNLTSEEKGYLAQFIQGGENTIRADIGDGVAGGLMAKEIIYRSSSVFSILEGAPYNLQPWARKYLTKHHELLNGAVGEPRLFLEKPWGLRR
jgi:hypothetical protein